MQYAQLFWKEFQLDLPSTRQGLSMPTVDNILFNNVDNVFILVYVAPSF